MNNMTRSVIYQRGTETFELDAKVSRTVFRIGKGGAHKRYESRDYLVLDSGMPVFPKTGDHIRETDGGKVFIYEVSAPCDEPWRYSGLHMEMIRIHTRFVGTEDAQ